jgi:HAD superfamily hydrolase (TIGR01509 family)
VRADSSFRVADITPILKRKAVPPFEAIIFDLDGVVIDSEPLHERADLAVFQQHGLEVPVSIFDSFRGKTDRDLMAHVNQVYAGGALDVDALIQEKQQAYGDLIGQLELMPGAEAFIRTVAQRFRLALTTSATLCNQQRAFNKFGLARYFEVVVTAADITRPKPDPEPYLLTAERLGLSPADCLVIEDSVNGVISGVTAGCTVAALISSFDETALEKTGAHLIVSDFQALSNALEVAF